jgi:hypothetical protein
MQIAVCTPTRGLVFTQVIEFIEKCRETHDIKLYLTHDLPIPESFNDVVERALVDNPDFIWFLEEDVLPPEGTLDKLLEALKTYDLASVDYGYDGGQNTVIRSTIDNRILFSGFGCTLVKKKVFDKMQRPYFRADKAFLLNNMRWSDVDPHEAYGMHDIYFGFQVRELGFKMGQIEGEATHLKLIELGRPTKNNGCHTIGTKDRISRPLLLPI